jgi:hypothetical protein
MADDGIPWLTDPQRRFLAHLLVVTLLPQMQRFKPDRGYTYDRLFEALADLHDVGDIHLEGDLQKVWVIVRGQVIVHATREWLEWMAPQWAAAGSASN